MQTSKENYNASKRANHLQVFEQIHSHEETENGGASRRAMAAGVTGKTSTTVEVASKSEGKTLTLKDASQLRKGMVYMRTVSGVLTYHEITEISGKDVTLDKALAVSTDESLDFMYRIQERLGYIQVTKNGNEFTVDPKYGPILYPGVEVVFYNTINDDGTANEQTSGTLTVDTSTGSTFTVNASPTWTPEYMSFVETSMTKLTDEQLETMSIFFNIDTE